MRRAAFAALAGIIMLYSGGTPTLSADPIFPPPGEELTPPPPATTKLSTFTPVVPVRLGVRHIGPGATATFVVAGAAGVPADGVSAVAVNVTVLRSTKRGALTVFPQGERRPAGPQVHFAARQAVAKLVTVKVLAAGRIAVNNRGGETTVAVDLQGWYTEASLADDVSGLRLRGVASTRIASRPLGPRQVTTIKVTGAGGIPAAGVQAVALTILATSPTAAGSLTIYPQGTSRPSMPNVRFTAGENAANVVLTKVPATGRVVVFNPVGSVKVIVSSAGWYGPGDAVSGGDLEPLTARRIAAALIGPRGSTTVLVSGFGGVPQNGVAGVLLNVTASGATAPSAITVYPAGAPRPATPNLFVRPGATAAVPAMVSLPADARIVVYNSAGATRVAVDVAAWYTEAGNEPEEAGRGGPSGEPDTVIDRAATVGTAVSGGPDMLTVFREMERSGTLPGGAPEGDAPVLADETEGKTEAELTRWQTGYATAIPAVGRIYMYRGGTFSGTCTGSVVARNLVVTAAHCVYDAFDGFYDGWLFVPGLSGTSKPLGEWAASGYVIPPYYVEQKGNFSPLDWSFLYFTTEHNGGKLPGDSTGYYPILYNSPGGYKYSLGYPSEGWFNTNCSTTSCNPYFCQSPIEGGDNFHLWLEDSTVSYGGWYEVGFGCFMTGGASGGPVFEYWNGAWYVAGVNSNITGGPKYTENCTRRTKVCFQWAHNMWSPYWNDYIGSTYATYALR